MSKDFFPPISYQQKLPAGKKARVTMNGVGSGAKTKSAYALLMCGLLAETALSLPSEYM
jgi:hypothetical protein